MRPEEEKARRRPRWEMQEPDTEERRRYYFLEPLQDHWICYHTLFASAVTVPAYVCRYPIQATGQTFVFFA